MQKSKKDAEAEFKELSKFRVKADDVRVARPQGYTNLNVEAFREAIDNHVESHFADDLARKNRLQEAAKVRGNLTKDQQEIFAKKMVAEENKYMRAQNSASTWSTDDFRIMKTLGQGGFGTVRLVQYVHDNQCYAMKQMSKEAFPKKNDLCRLFAERKCLIALCEQDGGIVPESNYFVKLYGCFQDDTHLYMIMEFLQGGDLISVLCERKRLSESETRFYIGQLFEAIDYIHRMGFVHRDIKPDNICFNKEGHLKLLDFGLCKEIDDNHKLDPQLLLSHFDQRKVLYDDDNSQISVGDYVRNLEIVARETYSKSVDLWAAGVVCYDCLVGSTPFNPRVGQGDPPELQKADAVSEFKIKELQKADAVNRVLYKIHRWKAYFTKAIQRGKQANLLREKAIEFLNSVVAEKSVRLNIHQIRQHKFFEGQNFKKLIYSQAPIIPKLTSATDTSKFPKLKESTLPKWSNNNLTIERIRYEAFDFQHGVKPDVNRIAQAVKEQNPAFPYLQQQVNHHNHHHQAVPQQQLFFAHGAPGAANSHHHFINNNNIQIQNNNNKNGMPTLLESSNNMNNHHLPMMHCPPGQGMGGNFGRPLIKGAPQVANPGLGGGGAGGGPRTGPGLVRN